MPPHTYSVYLTRSVRRASGFVLARQIGIGAAVTRRPPATPPCVRVRTRRFELVALAPIDQRRKPKRFEVSIGKPHREGFGPSEVPRAAPAARRVVGQPRTDSQPQVELLGDDAVFSIAATSLPAVAIGPNGLGTPAPQAFRRSRSSRANPADTELVPLSS